MPNVIEIIHTKAIVSSFWRALEDADAKNMTVAFNKKNETGIGEETPLRICLGNDEMKFNEKGVALEIS